MFFRFFDVPDGFKTWDELFRGETSALISYRYSPRFATYGSFELVVPYNRDILNMAAINRLIMAGDDEDNFDWLFIQTITIDHKEIAIKGYDLNYILTLRVSALGSGSGGYDTVSGTTAECIEHFVDKNIVSPADSARMIPLFFLDNNAIGDPQDKYMARLEPLNRIVDELCDGAGIGYRIYGSFIGNTAQLRMRLMEAVDKTVEQDIVDPVVLGIDRRNVRQIQFEHDISNCYNAIYATGAGVTRTVYRDSNIPEGFTRRECSIEVSAESVADVEKYALHDTADNVQTESFELEPLAMDFNSDFSIGDIVTIRGSFTASGSTLGNFYNSLIVGADIEYSAGGKKIKLLVGKQKPKLFNRIVRDLVKGTYKR